METLNSENQIDQTRLKRPDEDRISNLPDSVQQHILAFVSTKDAVRTSILSRRWQNLWKFVPCLDLETYDFYDESDFFNFLEKFVDLHGKSDLQKFKLRHYTFEHENSRLTSCIDVAVMCKLEHLDIKSNDFRGVGYFHSVKMPESLFLCNTLGVLKFSGVVVDVPKLVYLSSLKIMHLVEVVYADDSAFRTLISGCPVLEKLNIIRSSVDNVQAMCVCSQTLKWLSIDCHPSQPRPVTGIVIDAPHLVYLSLVDHVSEDLVMNNLGSSLEVEIDVTFDTRYGRVFVADDFSKISIIRRFLVGISNFKSLSFSSCTLQLLSEYLKLESLPEFGGVIHLKTVFGKYGWETLPALLMCSPNLKSFVLGLCQSI